MKISIASQHSTPRLSYVINWLNDALDIEVAPNESNDDSIIINYANKVDPKAIINIYSNGLLFESEITKPVIDVREAKSIPYFFGHGESVFDLPFDFFSMVFFLLSRYEEYTSHEKDNHGRWQSYQSVAVAHSFIRRPIVDLWLNELIDLIYQKTSIKVSRRNKFKVIPTIDIDIPLCYHKSPTKKYGALIRDLLFGQINKLSYRLKLYLSRKDPYDTYDYLLQSLKIHPNSVFFFLCKYKKPFDENHLIQTSIFQRIIKRIRENNAIGLHPSYSSKSHENQIKLEKNILEELSGQNITLSRQHFLRLCLPKTYQSLISAGISEDHSMMYPDQLGFRASTSHSFKWYDLSEEKMTSLTIHSPVIMDVTLKKYLGLKPEEAMNQIAALRTIVKEVDGQFEFIWHNSSFSILQGWKGWKSVFEYLLDNR